MGVARVRGEVAPQDSEVAGGGDGGEKEEAGLARHLGWLEGWSWGVGMEIC